MAVKKKKKKKKKHTCPLTNLHWGGRARPTCLFMAHGARGGVNEKNRAVFFTKQFVNEFLVSLPGGALPFGGQGRWVEKKNKNFFYMFSGAGDHQKVRKGKLLPPPLLTQLRSLSVPLSGLSIYQFNQINFFQVTKPFRDGSLAIAIGATAFKAKQMFFKPVLGLAEPPN